MATLTLLNAVTANQTGPAVSIDQGDISDDVSIDVSTTGSITAFSVQVQGSIDGGTTWGNIGSAITTVGLTRPASPPAATMFRAVLSGLTGSGTLTCLLGVVPEV